MKKALIALFIIVFCSISVSATTKIHQTVWGKINNTVCLTFDDGFNKSDIVNILNTLKKNDIKCTFFIIGKQLKAYPQLWQQAILDGHEICYHTVNHINMINMTNNQIKADIKNWNSIAHKILGKDYQIPKLIRAPGGHADNRVLTFLKSLGYTAIYWSQDTYSTVIKYYPKDPVIDVVPLIVDQITKTTKSQSIILFHFNPYDDGALSQIIDNLVLKKFNFNKISAVL